MKKLKTLRLKYGFKQKDLAIILGTTSQTILNWENGLYQPKIEQLIKLSQIFHCSVDYLISDDDEDKYVDDVCELIKKVPSEVYAEGIGKSLEIYIKNMNKK